MHPILLIHQGALGDLMLSLPALYSLRRFYQQASWTMVGRPELLSLLHHRFYALEVKSIDQKDWAFFYQEKMPLPRRFQDYLNSFERVYIFSSRYPDLLAGGLRRAGQESVFWLPSFPDLQKRMPVRSVQKKIFQSWGIPWIDAHRYLFPSDEDRKAGQDYLKQNNLDSLKGRSLWAIHPGSGSSHKNWPLDHFLNLASILFEQTKLLPFFIVGPAEINFHPDFPEAIMARGFSVVRDQPLTLLAGILSHCTGYLGNDSGISHLAAALGIPTIALFGPSDPNLWAPQGKKVKILTSATSCAPCTQEDRERCREKECFLFLSEDSVLEAISSAIRELPH